MATSAEIHRTPRPPGDRQRRPHGRAPADARPLPRTGGHLTRGPGARAAWSRPYGGTDVPWHDQTPAERGATRTPRGPWWSAPARQTIDLATALFPALLYERLDEIGIDFGVVYPSLGPRVPARRRRRASGGAPAGPSTGATPRRSPRWPTGSPRSPPSRCTRPRRRWPSWSTRSSHARVQGRAVRRLRAAPVRRAGRRGPRGVAVRVLARPVRPRLGPRLRPGVGHGPSELGVSIAFHSGFIGMTPYRSPTSYVANHLSMLAEGQQALAKSLVPRRGDPPVPRP